MPATQTNPTREEVERSVLQTFAKVSSKHIALDDRVGEAIEEEYQDAEFLLELQARFPRLTEHNLEKISDLYPVPGDDIYGEGGGLCLGRKSEQNGTFRNIAGYIYSVYSSPTGEPEPASD